MRQENAELYRTATGEFVGDFYDMDGAINFILAGAKEPAHILEKRVTRDGTVFLGDYHILPTHHDENVLALARSEGWTLQEDTTSHDWLLVAPNGYKFIELFESGAIALLTQYYRKAP